jgi:hypothetical protein
VPGAFDESIRWHVVRLAANHNRAYLAVQADGSLVVSADRRALSFTAVVDDENWAEILRTAARNRKLNGCSMAWKDDVGCVAGDVRYVDQAGLTEISVLFGPNNVPAIPGTTVEITEAP